MKATIITIGDEILIGQIVDTNSASIARHLNAAGIVVAEKESVGDDRDAIVAALRRAMDGSDVTILTGGLGPTKDDITKRTLAELFGCELVRDERVARHVRRMLESRGIAYNDLNRGQSLVPACCTVLFNAHGTAPGMWFERDGRVVVSLPGVPFEMEHLMQDEVMPRLKARFALRQIVHRTLITSGLAESMLAERIASWEAALPPYLHLAYLPSPDKVRLRLSAYEVEGEEVAHEIEAQFEKLRTIIPEYILGYETATIQSVVHDLLTQRHLTLATAESCTGGAIAARFTAMPGASAYFRCGVVSYTVEAKHDLLGVSLDDIDRYGVVSEPVVRAMAEGMRRTAHADYAVATTGVAGPAGGTPECPVGTVWMAVAGPQGTAAVCRQWDRPSPCCATRFCGRIHPETNRPMHEDPRKAPLPNDPAAHSDAVGRPVDASSRIAFTTSDGQPVEVPLLTLVPIPRLTIDEATVGFDMEVRSDGSTAVNGRCRTSEDDPKKRR